MAREPEKNLIKRIVKTYILEYPEEYALVKEAVAGKRQMTRDEFASVEGSDMRALYEISEKLQAALIMGMDEETMIWFKTKEGGRWFARTFPVFALPDSI